jgi:hypothetical protein
MANTGITSHVSGEVSPGTTLRARATDLSEARQAWARRQAPWLRGLPDGGQG